jgi:hypothetical protein
VVRWLAVLSLALAACGSGSEVEVGIVHFYGESEGVIEAPDAVDVGERFTVTVNTYGSGCTSAEWMAVESDEGSVELIPYDREESGACSLVLSRLPHTAEIEFSSSGAKSVVVRGRQVSGQHEAPFSVTHDLMVE